jgi:hypothetical protein
MKRVSPFIDVTTEVSAALAIQVSLQCTFTSLCESMDDVGFMMTPQIT